VIGVEDELKGQVAMAFAIVKDAARIASAADRAALEREIMGVVDRQLGAVARPARVYFVPQCCRRRAPASCCGARFRPSARAAIRAT
jgi:propionyl-CoA synthetase